MNKFCLVAVLLSSTVALASPGMRADEALEVCSVAGQIRYLSRVRCSDGSRAKFERKGNVGPGKRLRPGEREPSLEDQIRGTIAPGATDTHIVDLYEVTCKKQPASMYFDMYHCEEAPPPPDVAPPGMTIVPDAASDNGKNAAELEQGALELEENGRYEDARRMMRKSITLYEQQFGRESSEVAVALVHMVVLDRFKARRDKAKIDDEAEPLLLRAIAIHEKVDGRMSVRLVTPLLYQGALLAESDRWAEADLIYRHALQIAEAANPPAPAPLASATRALGTALVQRQEWQTAEPFLQRALALDEKLGNSDDVLDDLMQLVLIADRQGKHDVAKQTAKRTIKLMSKRYGENDEIVLSLKKRFGL